METITGLASWLFSFMVTASPLATHDVYASREHTEARYHEIAEDMAEVAYEEDVEPLFAGEDGRARTAILALSIARWESAGFVESADQQDTPTGDHGQAWCMAQLHAPYAIGLTDRRSCFRAEIWALRDSMKMCSRGALAIRIAGYTRGKCERGQEAELRAGTALDWWKSSPYKPLLSVN